MTFINHKNPKGPRVEVSKPYMITEQSLEYFTNPDLMGIIIFNDFQADDFGRALAHLSYKNKKLSKTVCLFVLNSLKANNDADKLPAYLNVIEELV